MPYFLQLPLNFHTFNLKSGNYDHVTTAKGLAIKNTVYISKSFSSESIHMYSLMDILLKAVVSLAFIHSFLFPPLIVEALYSLVGCNLGNVCAKAER
jgi:hypothetical protein